ncbi:MAG TPA: hypothetical protein VMS17_10120 [Gemmataceae bacterium]|nr:hypothetical protein [Gemmataceae bacterium]
MTSESADLARMIDPPEWLRGQAARLNSRGAALEAHIGKSAVEPLSEELVMVVSAAIAAFLGKRPHIRQIRLLRSDAWAQQGRAIIQASHMRPH